MNAVKVTINNVTESWVSHFSGIPTLEKLQDAIGTHGESNKRLLAVVRAAKPTLATEFLFDDNFTRWSTLVRVAGTTIGKIQYENVSVTQLTEEETFLGFTRMGEAVGKNV